MTQARTTAQLISLTALLLSPPGLVSEPISIKFSTISKAAIEARLHSVEDTNSRRQQSLKTLFENSGCIGGNLTEQKVKYAKVPNTICTLAGETGSVIVVGGHFDFVDAGKGVVDNWSGCSLLPSLYQSLSPIPRRHTFIFAGFTDEERGLVGSRFYVNQVSKEQMKKISAMVNIDSVGTSSTKIELDRGDKTLANALALVAGTFKLPLDVVNVHNVGRSDSDSFQDHHVPALAIHSLTQETFPILHTRRDQMNAIRLDDYYDTYLLVRAYLAYLDQVLDPNSAPQENKK